MEGERREGERRGEEGRGNEPTLNLAAFSSLARAISSALEVPALPLPLSSRFEAHPALSVRDPSGLMSSCTPSLDPPLPPLVKSAAFSRSLAAIDDLLRPRAAAVAGLHLPTASSAAHLEKSVSARPLRTGLLLLDSDRGRFRPA